jgi:transcription antitermination factor NusG
MKGIQILILIFIMKSSWSMDCTNSLTDNLVNNLQSNQTLINLQFRKILAPKERFLDENLGRKLIVNRYEYPVYYFLSIIEFDTTYQATKNVYLLSPNSCKILKRGSLVMN